MSHSHKPTRLISRRHILRGGVSLGAAAAFGSAIWAQSPQLTAEIAKAAQSWLATLSDAERSEAQRDWSDAREDWHYIPRNRPGLTLGEMNDKQSDAAWDLFGTLLSANGIERLRGAVKVERVLGELTGNLRFRDPGNYALVVFGDPANANPWAWRFEGHHLSINVVIVPGEGLSVTPVFYGSNPAKVPQSHQHAGFRLLGEEEDGAFGLIRSLEGKTREAAIIGDRSLGNIVSGPGRETILQDYEGVPLAELNDAQRNGVFQIAQLYAGTMREEIANAAMQRLREAGHAAIHFAWAGSLERGQPHYFRIHSPAALIEYDNTQNGANHVHSIWIDPDNLFGRDLLRAHYKRDH